MTIKSIPIAVSVYREGESPIFGEHCTRVEIDDEAAGPFIVLKQVGRDKEDVGLLRLDLDELEEITRVAVGLVNLHKAASSNEAR